MLLAKMKLYVGRFKYIKACCIFYFRIKIIPVQSTTVLKKSYQLIAFRFQQIQALGSCTMFMLVTYFTKFFSKVLYLNKVQELNISIKTLILCYISTRCMLNIAVVHLKIKHTKHFNPNLYQCKAECLTYQTNFDWLKHLPILLNFNFDNITSTMHQH